MSDFLTITNETAAIIQPETKGFTAAPVDTRFWKPSIKNEAKEYQAMVRPLPRGIQGIKNRLNPSVKILTHRLKSESAKVFRNIKCPKTLGSDQFCPICDAAWAIFNEGKAQNNKALMDQGKDILPKESHIMNIMIRNDSVHAELNGQVKLWEHTGKMNETLFEPTKEQKLDPSKPAPLKKKKIFYPYSPKDGRDFLVVVTENPKNGLASYESSEWDELPSDIASTDGEITSVLDKCYDLNEFLQVPTADELAQKLAEFRSAVERKESGKAANGAPAFEGKASGSTGTAHKNVSTGDAQSYFQGGSTNQQDLPMGQPDMSQSSEDSASDDELPF